MTVPISEAEMDTKYNSPHFNKLVEEYWNLNVLRHNGHDLVLRMENAKITPHPSFVTMVMFCGDCRELVGLIPLAYDLAVRLQGIRYHPYDELGIQ